MDERTTVFIGPEADLANQMIMEYTLKQKGDVYISYDQIRWAVLRKVLEYGKSGKKKFNFIRLIKKTIKEERAKGNLLPEEWE